ncbi:MAG: hypothetical protein IT420_09095 [Candidatus Brocadia sp.]|jgi:hypothetical protein|nr:hypothetical protein [Candidatus Brocadia fulgida]MCC6325779.1 hypothetical protein [Candidatus Brocadia sp.]MDG5997812.1 hypothetical protein [Candidatus Brocadia sp.]
MISGLLSYPVVGRRAETRKSTAYIILSNKIRDRDIPSACAYLPQTVLHLALKAILRQTVDS